MQLRVTRTKQPDLDRRGNVRNVYYGLSFALELTPEEQSLIENNGLKDELIFQSQAKIVSASELINGETSWHRLNLELALSIQNSMMENCKKFARLARIAATFEGTDTIDLS